MSKFKRCRECEGQFRSLIGEDVCVFCSANDNSLESLTVKEASDLMFESNRCVKRLCADGTLRGAVQRGYTWKIPKSSVDQYNWDR